jgi:hypothetical protein
MTSCGGLSTRLLGCGSAARYYTASFSLRAAAILYAQAGCV